MFTMDSNATSNNVKNNTLHLNVASVVVKLKVHILFNVFDINALSGNSWKYLLSKRS